MKYLIIVGDGMADERMPQLGGKSPLEVADIPTINRLARQGVVGHAQNCPPGFSVGSDIAHLSILGCDPSKHFHGRGPMEAAALGFAVEPTDAVFRCNLLMIDLHFPRMLAEMVRLMHLDGITRISELTERIKEMNPLKIKDELINKHRFYEFKMKQFLLALALGMRPAKIYNGTDSAVEGIFLTDGSGQVLCYHKSRPQVFADFLYQNTRLEKGAVEKDKYGFLERENGVWYFKLNVKIGLVKR